MQLSLSLNLHSTRILPFHSPLILWPLLPPFSSTRPPIRPIVLTHLILLQTTRRKILDIDIFLHFRHPPLLRRHHRLRSLFQLLQTLLLKLIARVPLLRRRKLFIPLLEDASFLFFRLLDRIALGLLPPNVRLLA